MMCVYNEIYFKKLAHATLKLWRVQNQLVEAGRLETQDRAATQVQWQAGVEPVRANVAGKI